MKVSKIAIAFSIGVSGCKGLAGARIYPPFSPTILRNWRTSARICAGVPIGSIHQGVYPPHPQNKVSKGFWRAVGGLKYLGQFPSDS